MVGSDDSFIIGLFDAHATRETNEPGCSIVVSSKCGEMQMIALLFLIGLVHAETRPTLIVNQVGDPFATPVTPVVTTVPITLADGVRMHVPLMSTEGSLLVTGLTKFIKHLKLESNTCLNFIDEKTRERYCIQYLGKNSDKVKK